MFVKSCPYGNTIAHYPPIFKFYIIVYKNNGTAEFDFIGIYLSLFNIGKVSYFKPLIPYGGFDNIISNYYYNGSLNESPFINVSNIIPDYINILDNAKLTVSLSASIP